jgi:hypothetical protein
MIRPKTSRVSSKLTRFASQPSQPSCSPRKTSYSQQIKKRPVSTISLRAWPNRRDHPTYAYSLTQVAASRPTLSPIAGIYPKLVPPDHLRDYHAFGQFGLWSAISARLVSILSYLVRTCRRRPRHLACSSRMSSPAGRLRCN